MTNKQNKLTRIHVYELRIGMCICHLEIANKESPFLFDRFDVKTQTDIQAIQSVCDYVYIKRHNHINNDITTRKENATQQLSIAKSIEQSAYIYQKTGNLIKSVMDDVRFGNQLSVKAVKEATSQCVEQVLENSDTMLLLTQLKHRDKYTAQHSLNVCILAILLGRELKFSNEELNIIGLYALLHDIGKMKVPLEILNKPGKLENDELEIMRKHAEYGRDILMTTLSIDQGAVEVAYRHHQSLDGSGYPKEASTAELSIFTKIVSIVDTYDAITSDRVYQKGRAHFMALDILAKGMNTLFETDLIIHFINCIGFYPQGNLVELSSGEIGIVIEQNKKDQLRPKILLILDKNNQKTNECILDLSSDIFDINGDPYKINKVARPQDYNIDLTEYYYEGKFIQSYPVIA